MDKNILSEFQISDMHIRYLKSEQGLVGLEIIPYDMIHQDIKLKDCAVDSIVQVKLEEDDEPNGFANGHTMRNGQSVYDLRFEKQEVEKTAETVCITTTLANRKGQKAVHILEYQEGQLGFSTRTKYINTRRKPVVLEMLSSFSIGEITPFVEGDAHDTLLVHRIRSRWSSEGRVETQTAEELQLEPSWSKYGVQSEKFGQVGSMPVRKYFPFAAIEDKSNGVVWAVQVGCPSSWQIEVYRKDNGLCVSGGLADYQFGHWKKELKQDEWFETPRAFLTVAKGTLDSVCQRLTHMAINTFEQSTSSSKLPVIFNEFCTTWGSPSYDNICRILEKIKDKDIDYFVIDAGWYADPIKGWESNMGDWRVSKKLFPNGLESVVSKIEAHGFIPGIWFELEVCGRDADAFYLEEHLLKRNGKVITVGNRRFWDMRDPWTKGYLQDKVIAFIKKCGFKYLKIDYNDSIGIGCDGAESLGEGLRQNMFATQTFFKALKENIPDLVIEICSSGGHRLEPSMMKVGDMASFSDAHEEKEIPIIAANVHRMILPSQSLIWAVLRKKDSMERIVYSMTGTFLGSMCLSGDIYDLNDKQWQMVELGIQFYRNVSGIIMNGLTEFYGTHIGSYRFPEGWQGILRYGKEEKEALLVVHTFHKRQESFDIEIPLKKPYKIITVYAAKEISAVLTLNKISFKINDEFDAVAIHLEKDISD